MIKKLELYNQNDMKHIFLKIKTTHAVFNFFVLYLNKNVYSYKLLIKYYDNTKLSLGDDYGEIFNFFYLYDKTAMPLYELMFSDYNKTIIEDIFINTKKEITEKIYYCFKAIKDFKTKEERILNLQIMYDEVSKLQKEFKSAKEKEWLSWQ